MRIPAVNIAPLPGQVSSSRAQASAETSARRQQAANRQPSSAAVIEAEYVDLYRPAVSLPSQERFKLDITLEPRQLSEGQTAGSSARNSAPGYLLGPVNVPPAGSFIDIFV